MKQKVPDMLKFKLDNKGYILVLISVVILIILNTAYLSFDIIPDRLYYSITIALVLVLLFGCFLLQKKIQNESNDVIQKLIVLYQQLIKDNIKLIEMESILIEKLDEKTVDKLKRKIEKMQLAEKEE